MAQLRLASEEERDSWWKGRTERLRAECAAKDFTASDTTEYLERVKTELDGTDESAVYAIVQSAEVVGFAAFSASEETRRVMIDDIWITPQQRRRGYGASGRLAAQSWARQRGAASIMGTLDPNDPAQDALFAPYDIAAQRMVKWLRRPPEPPDDLVARPMSDADFRTWYEQTVESYAAHLAGSGVVSVDDATERSRQQIDRLLPDGPATPDHAVLTITAADERVATLWLHHHLRTEYSFVYNVMTEPEHRGKGYGRGAMLLAECATLDAGDKALGLNVFGQNRVAINLYDSLGFRITDQTRTLTL